MPRRALPVLEVKATRTGAWARLTTCPDEKAALLLGDLVAADLDEGGTWPRWFEVRIVQASTVVEHWTVRELGPLLAPTLGGQQAYLAGLLKRTGHDAPQTPTPRPRRPRTTPRHDPGNSAVLTDAFEDTPS